MCVPSSPGHASGSTAADARRSCSWTRSTASTRRQQDALLPQVEDGTLTLIGATTENPYFEVNSALLSRLRVFRLEPLSDEELGVLVDRALADARGLGGSVELSGDAREHLVAISAGDARAALNVLEAAAGMAGAVLDDASSQRRAMAVTGSASVSLELIEAAAQQRILAYDRAGDGHYGTVSAFIKSMRGNDLDATLYWLATMVAAGEDPRFIARRIVICASEDVGNADPRALQVAVAAAGALELVGLPEAQYALAQAAAYVAAAPKSNRVGQAYLAAVADVQSHGSQPVPPHLLPCQPPTDADPRHRRGLPLPARLRGGGRRAAVPAGPARRQAVLHAVGPGHGAPHRRAARPAGGGPQAREAASGHVARPAWAMHPALGEAPEHE